MGYFHEVIRKTDQFADFVVCENIVHGYEIDYVTFDSLQLTPYCLEKSSAKKRYVNVLKPFSVRIRWGRESWLLCLICPPGVS